MTYAWDSDCFFGRNLCLMDVTTDFFFFLHSNTLFICPHVWRGNGHWGLRQWVPHVFAGSV
jgi:hypothetical protein